MGIKTRGAFHHKQRVSLQLAKCPEVEITFFLPQCSREDRNVALQINVKIVEATPRPGIKQQERHCFPSKDLQIDVIVGHGVTLGRQAYTLKEIRNCKWLQVVSTNPLELWMSKSSSYAISKGEKLKYNQSPLILTLTGP